MRDNPKFLLENKLRYNFYSQRVLNKVVRQTDLSPGDLKDEQEALVLKLVRRAYRHSAFYRQLYDTYGVNVNKLNSIEDIQDLPIITKQDIRKNYENIFIGSPLIG